MIHSLSVKNFQSHKDSLLEFSPGLNVIVGTSDSGKSSLLRALRWLVYGQPRGSAFLRHGTAEAEVQAVFEDVEVRKRRTKNVAEVCSGTDAWANVGSGLPEELVEAINLREINFEGQYDGFFLVKETPGEVARILNEISHLGVVDRLFSWFLSQFREVSRSIEETETKIQELSFQKSGYQSFLESNEGNLELLGSLISARSETVRFVSRLEKLVPRYGYLVDFLERERFLEEAEDVLGELEEGVGRLFDLERAIRELTVLKDRVEELEALPAKDFSEVDGLFDLVAKKREEIACLQEEREDLERLLGRYRSQKGYCQRLKSELEQEQDKSPEVCPLCGGMLDEDSCLG